MTISPSYHPTGQKDGNQLLVLVCDKCSFGHFHVIFCDLTQS
ncbi:hypothetical protein JCM19239_2513 [Vibrio variabilis]|uniref:Uncharacterized protein n=1 Tax=Vibrio variabilis TaxID=990271 RepID=A0ABQ0JFK9_9VIBR|nr:hypothetical protein JCM19239_2513 [Vibrio variabilis]